MKKFSHPLNRDRVPIPQQGQCPRGLKCFFLTLQLLCFVKLRKSSSLASFSSPFLSLNLFLSFIPFLLSSLFILFSSFLSHPLLKSFPLLHSFPLLSYLPSLFILPSFFILSSPFLLPSYFLRIPSSPVYSWQRWARFWF